MGNIGFSCDVCDVTVWPQDSPAADYPVHVPMNRGVRITGYCSRHHRWLSAEYWMRRYQWRVGKLSQWLFPGYGSCHRCHTTWNIVDGHDTSYSEDRGCFPLCEQCWHGLTPETRLPFYKQLWAEWTLSAEKHGHDVMPDFEWQTLEAAVLRGE